MAKAILEYDLTDFDDRVEHFRAVKSGDLANTLFEIINRAEKHNFDGVNDKEGYPKEFIDVQEILQIMEGNGINLDELIR